jgi:hypothetical protein
MSDIGCNRGGICDDCVFYGARVVHGAIYLQMGYLRLIKGSQTTIYRSRFEIVDLTGGPGAVKKHSVPLSEEYDFMRVRGVSKLRHHVGRLCVSGDHHFAHARQIPCLARSTRKTGIRDTVATRGFKLVHYSTISEARESYASSESKIVPQPAAIWSR